MRTRLTILALIPAALAVAGCDTPPSTSSYTQEVTATATSALVTATPTPSTTPKPVTTSTPSPAATAAANTTDENVTLKEWAVETPQTTQAAAGKVTFAITNAGKLPHEFVVLKTDKRADQLGSGSKVPEPGNVGEKGGIAPGASAKLTLKLAPGHYALICNLPGHYSAGMYTDLTVKKKT